MVTFDQVSQLGYGSELHYTGRHECKVNVGPRGGVSENITRVRVSGSLKTWKRQPGKFRLPVKHGLRDHGAIDDYNIGNWHLASECPALAQYADFVAEQIRSAQEDDVPQCELCHTPGAILGPNGYFCNGPCSYIAANS